MIKAKINEGRNFVELELYEGEECILSSEIDADGTIYDQKQSIAVAKALRDAINAARIEVTALPAAV